MLQGGPAGVRSSEFYLLKVTNGRITDNWHIEDNLTLLTQMGVAKVEQ